MGGLKCGSTRHDDVLKVIFDFLQHNMAAGFQITADLPGQQYTFPQDIAPMDLRPNIVMWSTSAIYLVELTVPFETNIAGAAERKVHRYHELSNACGHSHNTSIITLEVRSRGFLNTTSFQQLYRIVQAKVSDRANFRRDIIRHVVLSSHDFIVQCNETFHVERTVTPRTGYALTSKSLPEIQQRHQGRCVIDSCPREQRFAVAFTTKRSLKKMSVGLL